MNCHHCEYVSPTLRLSISHLRLVHSKDPNFNISCGLGNCNERFLAFSAFNSRHHRMEMGLESVQPIVADTSYTSPPITHVLETIQEEDG